MDRLFTLIELHRRAQQAESITAFGHIAVNESHKLIPYDEAVFWLNDRGAITLEMVSGNALLEKDAPYALALKELIGRHVGELSVTPSCHITAANEMASLPDREACHGVLAGFVLNGKGVIGGLWLLRQKPFQDAECQILQELAQGYAAGLGLHVLQSRPTPLSTWRGIKKRPKLMLTALIVLALWPVRLSVSAPAEIAARDALLVSIPFDGTIEEVLVSPGDIVAKDQPLARMEQTALRARMEMAQESLSVAQARLSRVRREVLSNPEKRMEMGTLQAEIALKKIDYDFAKSLLGRSDIVAPRDGIAIFPDKNALLGKPVTTGDSLMQIAGTQEKELLVRIPAEAMIPLDGKNSVRFHMNARPFKGYDAQVRTMGYQASTDADGLLTYKIRCTLLDSADDVRIGWKGSATIKGPWTVLSYAVLRRPLAALRRSLGV